MGGFRSSGDGDVADFAVDGFFSADGLPACLGPVARVREKKNASLRCRDARGHTNSDMGAVVLEETRRTSRNHAPRGNLLYTTSTSYTRDALVKNTRQ